MTSSIDPGLSVHGPRRDQPPLVRGLPVLGLMPQWRRDPLSVLDRVAPQCPQVARVPFPLIDLFVITHPDGIRHVLQENQANYTKGFDYERLEPLLGQGLLTANGESWRAHRRMIQPAFHKQRLANFGAVMLARTDAMLARWRQLPGGTKIDLHTEMMRLTLEVVGQSLFSTDMGPFVEALGRSLGAALELADERVNSIVAWPTWVPTPFNLRLGHHIRALDGIVDQVIARRLREGGPEDDLLGMLLSMRTEDGAQGLSPRELRDEVMTLILAGHETTANALTFTFHLLSHDPVVRERLQEAVGSATLTPDDAGRVPLVRMVAEESMRLYPPAWVVARQATDDDAVAGYRIPKDSLVLVSPWLAHRDPRFWTDPLRFDPDRFSPERGEPRDRMAYLPFGAGPRMCIGKGFAMMELELIIARITQAVELESGAPERLELEPTITLRPRHGLPTEIVWR